MEFLVVASHLEGIKFTLLYGLVKGELDVVACHIGGHHFWRQLHLIIIKAVETQSYTLSHLLFAQRMDIYRLA